MNLSDINHANYKQRKEYYSRIEEKLEQKFGYSYYYKATVLYPNYELILEEIPKFLNKHQLAPNIQEVLVNSFLESCSKKTSTKKKDNKNLWDKYFYYKVGNYEKICNYLFDIKQD